MISRNENIACYFGRVVFILIFIFFISVFSDKPVKKTGEAFQYEQVAEWHANSANAVIANAYHFKSVDKALSSLVDKKGFLLLNVSFRRFTDDKIAIQKLVSLQKVLFIRTVIRYPLYYLLFETGKEDLPVLS